MLILQNISYTHTNKEILFSNIHLSIQPQEKIALIGNNGIGKSILMKIVSNELKPSSGTISLDCQPFFIPQNFGQLNHFTIAQALRIDKKLQAIKEIMNGNTSDENFTVLSDDWLIEERCKEALQYWQLDSIDLSQKLDSLSGGEKTKVFLAGISIHQSPFIVMDEPSNHLDNVARQLLYEYIETTKNTLLIVSHDRKLLNLIDVVAEMNKEGIKLYGGNYAFYKEQKKMEMNALSQDIHNKEKEWRKAKEIERETMERQQKLDSRGKAKQEKGGVAKIMLNTLRNKAENSTSRLKQVHAEKVENHLKELNELRNAVPDVDKMKFGLENSTLHRGKILVQASGINFIYTTQKLWKKNIDLQITSGERIALKGKNGSGKTTLIKLIVGSLLPHTGTIYRAETNIIYIDQEYSLLNNSLTIYEQAQQFNTAALQEHEIKIRLNRFLFTKDDWEKPCHVLSGGERMRLLLCCLTIRKNAPDIIILDEPTNNLDIQNVEILTKAINAYKGTLIVISHDDTFLEQVNIERNFEL